MGDKLNYILTILILIILYISIMIMSGINMLGHRIKTFSHLKDYSKCYCDYCGKPINQWLANLPVINYLYLRGKTQCCNSRINPYHPVSEIIGGFIIFFLVMGVLT